jgi:hypothetical protein
LDPNIGNGPNDGKIISFFGYIIQQTDFEWEYMTKVDTDAFLFAPNYEKRSFPRVSLLCSRFPEPCVLLT